MPASNYSETIRLAADLVRVASVTPNDNGCQAIIAKRLKRLGFNIESLNCGEVSNLYARRGEHKPHLTFVGHTDVVPTGAASDWRYPPFSGTIADGYVHGRGAADMKGSIAAMITACERMFQHKGSEFPASVSFLITSDEEGPAVDGIRYALECLVARGETFDYCLVGEPTSENSLGDTIKVGRRGSLTGRITVRGCQGHVAYPHLADNPIHRSGDLIAKLANKHWSDGDSLFPDSALQISNVFAGVGAHNVIPGELELTFNIRFSPTQTVSGLKREIHAICQATVPDFEIEWQPPSEPYRNRIGSFENSVADRVFEVTGARPLSSAGGGTSDGRFVATTGAQVVELGPLNATIHQLDERVGVADLDTLSTIFQRILERLAEPKEHV